jgi:osmotically-inducible protein OsmY
MELRKRNLAVLIFTILCVGLSLTAWATDRPSDATITLWVKEALHEDPRIDASEVNVEIDSGVVTLTGIVKSLAAKKYADLESKKIQGVRSVINEIVVWAKPRPDSDITKDILRKFVNIADVNYQGISVEVFDGQVTLKGQVTSWSEQKEAELLATEVRGVKSVANNLQVLHKAKRTDDEIQKDIIATIDRDVYLSGLPIGVTVQKGIVTLKGSVANAYQKERAWSHCLLVENVKNVKNLLDVGWGKNNGVRRQLTLPSNEQLKKNIRDELVDDLRVSDPFEIVIEVVDGNVTLRGSVPSYYQKRLAGQDAREVVGVAWVSNLLTVKAGWREDALIQDDVQFEMDVDYTLNSQVISIHVKDGIVMLSGDVDTFYQKMHAAEVASRVRGVRDIVNTIKVSWAVNHTDTELRDRIKRRLASNIETRWVSERITVKVKNGIATLTGDVDTWAEYKEAARVASLTEAVLGVTNQLSVASMTYLRHEST